MRTVPTWLALSAVVAMVGACGSASDGGAAPTPTADAGAPPAVMKPKPPAPDPPPKYPAFPSDGAQVVFSGGKVLASPKLVLVHYAGDPGVATADTLIKKLGASAYWSSVTKEYGIGAGTVLPAIELPDVAPATMDDADIKTWLAMQLDGTHPEFPAPDGTTVYVLLYPKETAITKGTEKGCTDVFGYHAEAPVAGKPVPYVVVPHCTQSGFSDDETLTITLSHELVEVVLDPFLKTGPAYLSVDAAHSAWSVVNRESEPADLCAGFNTQSPELGLVQRSWSNAASTAGHDPCVPAPPGPYVAAVPQLADKFNFKGSDIPVVTVPVGQSRTIELQLSSDAPSDDFTVSVHDVASLVYGQPTQLSFKLDKNSGHNGEILHLTIKALVAGKVGVTAGLSTFVVFAKTKTGFTYWPAFAGN